MHNSDTMRMDHRLLRYRFTLHQHPYAERLMQKLIEGGIPELQSSDTDYEKMPDGTVATFPAGKEVGRYKPVLHEEFFEDYHPTNLVDAGERPSKDLDFASGGAYSVYNWELFYHIPFTIAVHLSKNQRFAEAQKWFHFIFDPTDDGKRLPDTPQRFWKVRPFHFTEVVQLEKLLGSLASGEDASKAEKKLKEDAIRSITNWLENPFRPHAVARFRQQAHMYKTVMAYLDNLIEWGDSLFRQDSGEAVDEALQLYVLAANLLGPRPQPVPRKRTLRTRTYASLRTELKRFGTAMVELEGEVTFNPAPAPQAGLPEARLISLKSLGKALYFCVPHNEKLLGYWDTVADRLFKIRNSQTLHGTFRQLALFDPPIDPALLTKAIAAGVDVGAVVTGMNQPLPLVRFSFLVQRATEIALDVKSLGYNLLAAMEKEDGEAMALLRAKHERAILGMVEAVRYSQHQEAIKAKEGLWAGLQIARERYAYYERLLGREEQEIEGSFPQLAELDTNALEGMQATLDEPRLSTRPVDVNNSPNLEDSGGKIVSRYEQEELARLWAAQKKQEESADLSSIAKFLSLIPEFGAQAQPGGVGAVVQFGGRALSWQFSFLADSSSTMANRHTYEANRSSKIGAYDRREQEWKLQSNLAAGEINQYFKQIRAAEIREAIAEQEWKNHRKQIAHAEEVEAFLKGEGTNSAGKKTTQAFYAWMKREVKALYSQCFQHAFNLAKKAERALQHELGDKSLSYVQSGYLSGKEGLLAGDRLYLDLKRMEAAYHDLNRREYEITKNISLLQVDPYALVQLRTTGRCLVRLTESLFDMDGPGHYFRRIKSVAVSVPCVVGPYAGVNCTFLPLKGSIRKSPALSEDGGYARQGAEDNRFDDHSFFQQGIFTSLAQNDSGLFDANLRDERYLPCENHGAISEWLLRLPADPSKGDIAQFDYNSISDVVIHMSYTAREGGERLRDAAMAHLKEGFSQPTAIGSTRLFSVRHEFPAEWLKFQKQDPPDGKFSLAINLREEHYPYWSRGLLNGVEQVGILAKGSASLSLQTVKMYSESKDGNPPTLREGGQLVKDKIFGGLLAGNLKGGKEWPFGIVGEWKIFFDAKSFSDLWILPTWK